jgi:hypothetical protein
MDAIKIRRAPSGKFYAVWHGCPICLDDGNLRYFDTEQDVRDMLQRCDLVLSSRRDVALSVSASSTGGGRMRKPSRRGRIPATKAPGGVSRLSVVR